MASRSIVKRLGAAILGASLVLMSALPAAADKPKVVPHGAADEKGMGVYLERDGQLLDGDKKTDGKQAFSAKLLGLKLTEGGDEDTAKAYCVELPTLLDQGEDLEEVPWGEHPNPDTKFKVNAAKINWVLQNSYPALEADKAAELYGVGEVEDKILIAATQAAVWHFSDGVNLRAENSTEGEKKNADNGTEDALVLKVYEFLTGKAVDLAEPKPTLEVAPKDLTGKAGEKIGPFVVSTTADKVLVTAKLPTGVTLVDQAGKVLEVVKEDEVGVAAATKTAEVWVDVPAGTQPGEFEFTVSADAQLRSGRLFVASDKNNATQSLVIATSQPVNVKDVAEVKWVEATVVTTTPSTPVETTTTTTTTTTTAPVTTTTVPAGGGGDDDLANTGASIFVPLLIGVGLLGAGAGALLFLRRKRAA